MHLFLPPWQVSADWLHALGTTNQMLQCKRKRVVKEKKVTGNAKPMDKPDKPTHTPVYHLGPSIQQDLEIKYNLFMLVKLNCQRSHTFHIHTDRNHSVILNDLALMPAVDHLAHRKMNVSNGNFTKLTLAILP